MVVAGYLGSLGVMEIEALLHWLLPTLFVLVGVGLIFVQVDPERLREKIHSNPGLALYRFRAFRYGAALTLFAFAVVYYFEASR